MRALVVSNMAPSPAAPERGSFVRDQIAALRRAGAEIAELHFPPGVQSYPAAVRAVRARFRETAPQIVHAHYGLTGWVCLAARARPLVVTFHGTDVRHRLVGPTSRALARRVDLAGVASRDLLEPSGGRPGLHAGSARVAELPTGVDLSRFGPRPRHEARRRLDLDPAGRYLTFPADPSRAGKRADRAEAVAVAADATLLTAGGRRPEEMADLINAAACVLVPSDAEGFGLATVEGLACDVPVLATPVGIAPEALDGLQGCLAAPFDVDRWSALARQHLAEADPRVHGRARAERWSADSCALRVLEAWRAVLARAQRSEPQ